MIEDLGYTKGSDGFFRDAAGERLGVEMRTSADDDYKNPLFYSAADSFQRAGVGVMGSAPIAPCQWMFADFGSDIADS